MLQNEIRCITFSIPHLRTRRWYLTRWVQDAALAHCVSYPRVRITVMKQQLVT